MARKQRSKGPNFRGKIGKNAERQKKEGRSYGYLNLPKDVGVFKEEVTSGRNRIELDILPYLVTLPGHPDKEEGAVEGEYWYRRPYWVHYSVGGDNKTIICPKTIGKPCPICEYRQKQFKDPDIKKEDIIQKPQQKNLYAVIVLNQKDYEKDKIYVWDIAQGNFQAALVDDLAERPELEIFPNLEDGLTLSIRFNEETFNRTKFPQAGRIDYYERDYSYPESILDSIPKLDEILKILPYNVIEAEFLELDSSDVEQDNQEEKSAHRRSVSRGTKDDDQEEEQEERSTRRPKTIARTPKQEETEDDDQEEEQEKPTSTLSRSKVTEQPASARRRRREKEEPEPEEDDECPNNHTFGKDWDDFEDCEGCELFEKCGDKYEQLNG